MVNRGIVGGLPVGGFDDVVVVVVLRRVGRLFVKSESLSLICYRSLCEFFSFSLCAFQILA